MGALSRITLDSIRDRAPKRRIMEKSIFKTIWLSIFLAPFLLFILSPHVAAETAEGWWDHAQSVAQREGYQVITSSQLMELYQDTREFAAIDNRYSYEYHGGHLPGAINVPFDLSQIQSLSSDKRSQLLEAMGPDKEKIIVMYCRDFR